MHEIADTVFINYLTKMSAFCNSEYYQKLIRFVLLFREYINWIYCCFSKGIHFFINLINIVGII